MMTSFDANPKSVYISHRKADAKVYSAPMSKSSSGEKDSNSSTIEIALVICGDKERVRKALPIIKSAILFSESMLNIHLFTDFAPREELQNIVIFYFKISKNIYKNVYTLYYIITILLLVFELFREYQRPSEIRLSRQMVSV